MSPDQDRRAAILTMIGEAGDQGDDGMAGVGNVLLNRAQLGTAGGYADTPGAVGLQQGQFEAWNRNGRGLMAMSPQDPAYQRAAAIFDGLTSGQIGDNTKGATNFYAPAAQAALGRAAPTWGSSNVTAQIGGHVFSAPKGAVMRQQQADGGVDVDALAAQWGASPKSGLGGASAAPSATSAAASPGNAASGPVSDSGVDVDGLASMWGAPKPNDGSPAGDHALTITRGPFGSLAGVDPAKIAADQGAPANVPAGKVGDAGMAAGRGAIEGIPIAGPYLAAGLDRAIAVERSIHEDVPYSQALREVQDFAGATDAAHPTATTVGNIAGGIASMGGLGATAAGARALGITGENMLMRAVTGGVTNAAIGGADAAVRSGGDTKAIATGGIIGLAGGGAGPFIGRGAETAGNALSQYVQGFRPGAAADNALLAAVQGTGGDLPTMAQRLANNPGLSLMDVNPGARDLAQGLAAQTGDARNTLVQAYGQRAAGARDAVTGAYDAAMGPTPDVLATLNGIKATAASNAKAGFGAALANAKPVDTSAAIQALDAQIRPGVNGVVSPGSQIPLSPVQQRLQQIRGLLTTDDGSEVLTDPNRLHKIQSDLGVEGRTLLASSSGSDRLMGKAVMDARGNIVDAIDSATGGQFKPAQQQYASDMGVQDAFEKGMSIFQNRSGATGLEDRPEFWRQTVALASPGERQALILGARTAADNAMQGVRNAALKGETIPQIGANLDKLRAVLGDDQANTLAQRMQDARDMAATNAKLFEGSQTQPRQANKLAVAVRDVGPMSMEIGLPSFAAMTGNPMTAAALAGGALARRGFQVAGRAADTARNNALAGSITSTGQAAQDTVNRLMALAQQQGIPTAATGAGNALGATFQSLPIDAGRLQGRSVTSRQIRNLLLGATGGG